MRLFDDVDSGLTDSVRALGRGSEQEPGQGQAEEDGDRRSPIVDVNPLSLLTPGVFRELFRRPPPDLNQ